MNRPFRPRPLDIYKKLPIVRSVKDLDSDEASAASRGILPGHLFEYEQAHVSPSKRKAAEIPTPQFLVVDSYEQDYQCTFVQPSAYVRGWGSRGEATDCTDYDLDDEDEDWLQQYDKGKGLLSPESLEWILYKLEIFDHKARERAGVLSVFGTMVPVCIQKETAFEAFPMHTLRPMSMSIFAAVYGYWKEKRARWQKPILRSLQSRPPGNDVNPFNVFRPQEKAHRPHTRRMQRRENDLQSFEKLQQVRQSSEQARALLEILRKREETKRELLACEANLQKMWITLKHDQQVDDDLFVDGSLDLSATFSFKMGASYRRNEGHALWNRLKSSTMASGLENGHMYVHEPLPLSQDGMDSYEYPKLTWKRKRLQQSRGRHFRKASSGRLDAVLLVTKPIDSDKLAASGIAPPCDSSGGHFRGRIGRGGRIIFDRWNPLLQTPIGHWNISASQLVATQPGMDNPNLLPPDPGTLTLDHGEK